MNERRNRHAHHDETEKALPVDPSSAHCFVQRSPSDASLHGLIPEYLPFLKMKADQLLRTLSPQNDNYS